MRGLQRDQGGPKRWSTIRRAWSDRVPGLSPDPYETRALLRERSFLLFLFFLLFLLSPRDRNSTCATFFGATGPSASGVFTDSPHVVAFGRLPLADGAIPIYRV